MSEPRQTAKPTRKAAWRPAGETTQPRRAVAGSSPAGTQKPVLLAGGNPQIAKGDGDAVVQAYIEAMPGWRREVGRRLDALIVGNVPDVRKAVRWNSPFYGTEARGWFLNSHCVAKHAKVAFFRGTSLRPVPPVGSENEGTRYVRIREGAGSTRTSWRVGSGRHQSCAAGPASTGERARRPGPRLPMGKGGLPSFTSRAGTRAGERNRGRPRRQPTA